MVEFYKDDIREYKKCSKRFLPEKIDILLIAESPPFPKKDIKSYFYFSEYLPQRDLLFQLIIKVIYDLSIKSESLAYSNLPAWQQMEHALEQVKVPEVAPKQQVKAPELSGGESPRACTKHTNQHKYINTIVVSREQTLKYLSRYTKLGDTLGQVRTYDIRQFEMMERWIREGLSELQWMDILNQHYKYCKDTRKPIANSLGYFKIPVEKILSKTGSHKINNIIKGLGRKFKS